VAIGSLLAGSTAKSATGEIVNRPGAAEMEKTAEEIRAHGVKAITFDLDVTKADSVEAFHAATLKEFGKVDILCTAAGITAEHVLCNHPDGLFNKVMEVNTFGTYRAVKQVLPGMIDQKWGRIVNIASTAASVGAVTSGAYCASKAAVVGLMKCAALEGAPHGVTVNSISPTWVETKFGVDWMGKCGEDEGKSGADYISEVKAGNPQGRLIQPLEVGNLASYLCSEEAKGITMQDLSITAGSLW
jgi:NAD(P)-dependent dehydrogenase (short-subunit alcohol dehydrogenase family)